jgi:hypothetical protein
LPDPRPRLEDLLTVEAAMSPRAQQRHLGGVQCAAALRLAKTIRSMQASPSLHGPIRKASLGLHVEIVEERLQALGMA